jgi:hypothetical protein
MITIDGNDWLPTQLRAFTDRPVEGIDYVIITKGSNGVLTKCCVDAEWLKRRSNALKAFCASPLGAAQRTAITTASWLNPEIRQRRSDGLRAAWAKRKAKRLAESNG